MSDQLKDALNDERVAGTLFSNAFLALLTGSIPSITHATVYSDLSPFQAAFTGYSAQALSAWTPSVLTADFHAISYAGEVTFHNGGGTTSPTITGWMIYSTSGSNRLIAALAYGTPFQILAGSDYKTTPSWQLTGE